MKPPATTNPIVIIVCDVIAIATIGPIYLGLAALLAIMRHRRMAALAVALMLLPACSEGFPATRAQKMGCKEACARAAADKSLRMSSSTVLDDTDCVCSFNDGSVALTCRRPKFDGSCL